MMEKKQYIKAICKIIVCIVCGTIIYYVLRKQNFSLLQQISFRNIAICSFLIITGYFFSGIQYFLTLNKMGCKISKTDIILFPFMQSFWGILIPFQGTSMFAMYYLKTRYSFKVVNSITMILFLYLFNVIFAGITGVIYSVFYCGIKTPLFVFSVLALFSPFILKLLQLYFKRKERIPFCPVFLNDILCQFCNEINALLTDKKNIACLVICQIMRQICYSIIFVTLAYSLGNHVPALWGYLLAVSQELSVIIKFTPANLGIAEMISGLVCMFTEIPVGVGVSVSLFNTLLHIIIVLLIGGIGSFIMIGYKNFKYKLGIKRIAIIISVILLCIAGTVIFFFTKKPINLYNLSYCKEKRCIEIPELNGYEIIPFCKFSSEAKVAFDCGTMKSKLITPEREIAFAKSGVPVYYSNKNGGIVVFRDIPDNKLYIFYPNSQEYIEIKQDNVDYLLFRNAEVIDKNFYIVVYNNYTRKNYLRRYSFDQSKYEEYLLPSFNPPAGHTYEMEPPVFLIPFEGGVKILAGDKDIILKNKKISTTKIKNCERVLEAIALDDDQYAFLGQSVKKNRGNIYFFEQSNSYIRKNITGVPFNLRKQKNDAVYDILDKENRLSLYVHDIVNNHCSGLMDFGCNNIEGRMAWSQIYYLNGFLDALEIYQCSSNGSFLAPVINDIVKRLYMEVIVSDNIINLVSYKSKAFTKNRSLALFSVQSSRLLLLYDRCMKTFSNMKLKTDLISLRQQILRLEDHIECFDNQIEYSAGRVKTSKSYWYLAWPKGCDFPFDGVGVPYNHQNEWAYSLFETTSADAGKEELEKPLDIIQFYRELMLKDDRFPDVDKWAYWYGLAENGWEKDISTNIPAYKGNKSLAWISFRTIDVMSVLAALPYCNSLNEKKLLESTFDLVKNGEIYPFAARSVLEHGKNIAFNHDTVSYYRRAVVPYELSNSIWVLAADDRVPAAKFGPPQLAEMYKAIMRKAPSDAPALGKADYPGNLIVNVPKAQAMLLKAEILRQKANALPEMPNVADLLYQQLIDSSDSAKDGYPGWGVPCAWDAYGDGSVNPANTKYTIMHQPRLL